MTSLNQSLFDKSQALIPGGVNSPVRAFRSVGGTPVFFKKGLGSKLWDVDGKEYIDYINSWGPMIVGHAHPEVIAAVQAAAANSLSFSLALDHRLISATPSGSRRRSLVALSKKCRNFFQSRVHF